MNSLRRIPLLLLVPLVAAAQVPAPGQGTSRPVTGQERAFETPRADGQLPVFEFHSGFWVNLHHFLYQQARATSPAGAVRERGPEGAAWASAVEYYAKALAGRDLLFNGDIVAIKNRLAEVEGATDLEKSGLRAELVAALERAAPIYRTKWWAEHDRANRAWIAGVAPLARQHGRLLALRLASTYQASWPAAPIRVDVSAYAGSFGAYTTLEPLHVTVSSTDARNEGLQAFEILFHEASHALASGVREGIARECRMRNKPIPRDLWHALLFYTTGEIVRRTLSSAEGATGSPGTGSGGSATAVYTPYAVRHGLFERPPWRGQNFLQTLERHWKPYLDGRTDFDTAVARLVSAL